MFGKHRWNKCLEVAESEKCPWHGVLFPKSHSARDSGSDAGGPRRHSTGRKRRIKMRLRPMVRRDAATRVASFMLAFEASTPKSDDRSERAPAGQIRSQAGGRTTEEREEPLVNWRRTIRRAANFLLSPIGLELVKKSRAKHVRFFSTPQGVIGSAVQRAVGSSIASKHRITKGEANEVYAVDSTNGQELILRISRLCDSESRFQRERWAMEQCAKLGVPVPHVISIQTIEHENRPLRISIENRLPGVPLDELAEGNLSKQGLAELLRRTGAVLSKVHSVRTNGFGELDKDGNGIYNSIGGMFSRKELDLERLIEVARAVDCDPNLVDRAFSAVHECQSKYRAILPHLIHNDFAPCHVLISGDRISGIIDFEIAQGGDPIREFARWQFFYEDRYPLHYLKEGYENNATFGDDFERRLYFWKLYIGLRNLNWYFYTKNKRFVELCKDRLAKDMAHFN